MPSGVSFVERAMSTMFARAFVLNAESIVLSVVSSARMVDGGVAANPFLSVGIDSRMTSEMSASLCTPSVERMS